MSPALACGFSTTEPPRKPFLLLMEAQAHGHPILILFKLAQPSIPLILIAPSAFWPLVSNFQHSQPFILSGLPLPPLLALREPWLISLHLSWVETFSSYSSYAPYATSGWGWGEASSLFGIIFVLSFNSNSYSFLLQTISVFEVGPSCDIFHQPFEVHSSTHRLPWWLRR